MITVINCVFWESVMKIQQFRFEHPVWDNVLGYVLHSGGEAIVIDGMAGEEIFEFCRTEDLKITAVTNTHLHDDHTGGNSFFTDSKGLPYISPAQAEASGKMMIGDEEVSIRRSPGHSEDSVIFMSGNLLISGDTLFNGTVGNCYSGDYAAYFKSLDFLMSLPDATKIYAGHDLVSYAMGVARGIDPQNPHIDTYLSGYDAARVSSTIGQEKQVNPFVRWNDSALDAFRKTLSLPVSTPFERWRAMMTVH